jgi:hypothetical protein
VEESPNTNGPSFEEPPNIRVVDDEVPNGLVVVEGVPTIPDVGRPRTEAVDKEASKRDFYDVVCNGGVVR